MSLQIGPDGFQQVSGYRNYATCVVGNAVVDSPAVEREMLLDRLCVAGVNMVRFLHVAKDDRIAETSGRKISEYQPTFSEWEAGFPYLDSWMDSLERRGMLAWLTCHHRQRLTETEGRRLMTPGLFDIMFGPKRPAGIEPGEIHDLFFWFPELFSIVSDKSVMFARRYAGHRALGLLTIANEKWASRGRIYAMNQRGEPGASAYNRAWFDQLDNYLAMTGKTEKQMTAAELEQFKARVGHHVYGLLRGDLIREAGVTCPIGSSNIFGSSRLNCLVESQACDFDDFHLYPESGADPYQPTNTRNFETVSRSLHIPGRTLCCSEWGTVWQDGPLKGKHSDTRLKAPEYVGRVAAEQGLSVTCQYAAALGKLGDAKSGVYDSFDDAEYIGKFWAGAKAFQNTARITGPTHEISPEELWGYKPTGAPFVPPAIPGSMPWAKDCGGVTLPEIGWMK